MRIALIVGVVSLLGVVGFLAFSLQRRRSPANLETSEANDVVTFATDIGAGRIFYDVDCLAAAQSAMAAQDVTIESCEGYADLAYENRYAREIANNPDKPDRANRRAARERYNFLDECLDDVRKEVDRIQTETGNNCSKTRSRGRTPGIDRGSLRTGVQESDQSLTVA